MRSIQCWLMESQIKATKRIILIIVSGMSGILLCETCYTVVQWVFSGLIFAHQKGLNVTHRSKTSTTVTFDCFILDRKQLPVALSEGSASGCAGEMRYLGVDCAISTAGLLPLSSHRHSLIHPKTLTQTQSYSTKIQGALAKCPTLQERKECATVSITL